MTFRGIEFDNVKITVVDVVRLGLTWNMKKDIYDPYMIVSVEGDKCHEGESIGVAPHLQMNESGELT